MFSARLPPALTTNVLSRMLAESRRAGTPLFDLTESNPTAVGLPYPADLLEAFADPRGARYQPDALGLAAARTAVADAYRERGVAVDADRVVLTASTSEAYAFLFKLLCEPGDAVLVPQPSYPLFDLLAGLEAVAAIPYRLDPLDAWRPDRDWLIGACRPSSRAILVVSPNNPTGSRIRQSDRDWLAETAASGDMAIISDEVFADYPLRSHPDASSFLADDRALTFTLGGLSKSAGLPQMKLAWMIVSGPQALVSQALERLELIADTYLSVSTPVQLGAARWLEMGRDIRRLIRARLAQNLACLRAQVVDHPAVTMLEPEGGWSVVLRIPAFRSEEDTALRLLGDAQVLVHPGYFFDFPGEAYLVLSLLPDPAVFEEGVSRLIDVVERAAA